jgi:hypothetical protein
MKVSSENGIQNFQQAELQCNHFSIESAATDYRKSVLDALILGSYRSLNAKVARSKNCPLGVNTTTELKIQSVFKKDRTFAIQTLFYNILSTVPFKVVPYTGDTQFPMFLLLLECFLERTFCDGAQFSYRIFLNLRVLKKRPHFLNSSPTSKEGSLRLLSAPSDRF